MAPFFYLVLVQVAVCVAIIIVIRQVLLKDTMKAVGKLREAESELAKKEETVRKRIEDNEAEFRQKSAEAQEALARSRESMEKETARDRQLMLDEAKKERDRIVDEANRGKEKMRQDLIREADRKSLEYAGQVYELVFSEDLGRKLDQAFLDELLGALEEMDASSITISADAVQVECAHGMDQSTKDRIKSMVEKKFDVSLAIREKVAPELIAGIRIKLGSLEIDGSLLNRFREAIEELKKEHG